MPKFLAMTLTKEDMKMKNDVTQEKKEMTPKDFYEWAVDNKVELMPVKIDGLCLHFLTKECLHVREDSVRIL